MDILDPAIDFNDLVERTRNSSGAELVATTAMNKVRII